MVGEGTDKMDSLINLRFALDLAEERAYSARGTAAEARAREEHMEARRAYYVAQIALEHARDIEDTLTRDERRACLAGDAVFGDFMDEGASLCSAFKLVVGRAMWTPADIDDGLCTQADIDADSAIIDDAIDAANYLID